MMYIWVWRKMPLYQPRMYGPFKDQFVNLPKEIKVLTIEAVNARLKIDPTNEKSPIRSEMLKADLECFRRIHITDDYVLVYTVCDECRNYIMRDKKRLCVDKIRCLNCSVEPWYRIKMIYVGLWSAKYEEIIAMWRAWINTANEVLMS